MTASVPSVQDVRGQQFDTGIGIDAPSLPGFGRVRIRLASAVDGLLDRVAGFVVGTLDVSPTREAAVAEPSAPTSDALFQSISGRPDPRITRYVRNAVAHHS